MQLTPASERAPHSESDLRQQFVEAWRRLPGTKDDRAARTQALLAIETIAQAMAARGM